MFAEVDLIPFSLTFFIGLFVSPEIGMIVGATTHTAILLYSSGTPRILITKAKVDNVPYIHVKPDRALYYPSVEIIRTKLMTASTSTASASRSSFSVLPQEDNLGEAGPELSICCGNVDDWPIILDLSNVCEIDFTAAKVKNTLRLYFAKS